MKSKISNSSNLKEKYLLYLRKSRSDNPDETVEEVLAKHERDLQDLSIKMFGNRIPETNIYREIVSGETIDERPEIKKVLSRIKNEDIIGVFVVEPQRLSRGDWEDGGKILTSFKYSNTLIITPMKTYDLNDKFDYKFFKMELSQGNEYLEYTKEILRRGRERSIKDGNYIGSVAPYGWKRVVIDKSHTLEPVEKEVKAINLAIHLKAHKGLGWTSVSYELEKLGYLPRKAKHWQPFTLRDICLNPTNLGYVKWNSRKTESIYRDDKLVKTRPRAKEENIIYVKGKHPCIIEDVEAYYKIKNEYENQPRNKLSTELVNPLAGLVFCKNCGTAMTYRVYKKNGVHRSNPRLLCNNQKRCGTKSATFEDVYEALIFSLENIVQGFEIRLKNNDSKKLYDIQAEMIKSLETDLNKLEKRQEELYDFLEDGIYTKEVFMIRNDKLKKEREDLMKQIAYTKENAMIPIDYEEKIVLFQDVIKALKNEDVSAKEKNILLKSIISRIEYTRDSTNRTRWDDSKPEIEITLKEF